MTEEKFIDDSKTVLKFIKCYCDNKHTDRVQTKDSLHLCYKDKDLEQKIEYELCHECKCTLSYSYARLQQCPHSEKPKCRTCTEPCYEKNEWKKLAKIMSYSGMQLGVLRIKKLLKLE